MEMKLALKWLTITIFLCLSTISAYSVDADSLVGYWNFDEEGDPGKDSSIYGNHGKPEGDVEWEANGKYGGALKIDGSGWILVESSPSLEVREQVTIALWARFDKILDKYQRPIFKNGPDETNFASYSIALMRSGLLTGSFFFDVITDNGRAFNAGPTPPEEGEWIHIAGVYDGKEMRIYLNGKLDEGEAGNDFVNPQEQSGEIIASEEPLTLGSEQIWNSAVYHGLMDEVAIFSSALTAHEMQTLFQEGVADFSSIQPEGKLAISWGRIKVKG
jgi:hypothetical protein